MPPLQSMGDAPSSFDNPTSRRVQLQDLPARMQAGAYQLNQYQHHNVLAQGRSFNLDQGTPMNMTEEEWKPCSPKPASLHEEVTPDAPKPKKTRRRKAKPPLDEETAQKRRREALDKNKQAAAKCRARKKDDENRKQYELQLMKNENQILRNELSHMQEQLKHAKFEVERHSGCKDDALLKAKKFIEDLQLKCDQFAEGRRNARAAYGFGEAMFEEDGMMSGSGEYEGPGGFAALHINGRPEYNSSGDQHEFHEPSHPTASNGLLREGVRGRSQHQFPTPFFLPNVSDAVDYGTGSTESTLNPLWVQTKDLPKPSDDLSFDSAIAPEGSLASMLSSPTDIVSQNGLSSLYPGITSPDANSGFDSDMQFLEPSDPMLPTSTAFDTSFGASAPILDEEFDFRIPSPNVSDKINMDAAEMDMFSQMDSTYATQSPSSSKDSKQSSPTWEALQLQRPDMDASLRRDSALGPEVSGEQLIRDLSSRGNRGFILNKESLERRKRRISNSN